MRKTKWTAASRKEILALIRQQHSRNMSQKYATKIYSIYILTVGISDVIKNNKLSMTKHSKITPRLK